jgi:hypothetical protein
MKEARFVQVKRTFSMGCQVKINIRSKPEVIWALLTNANDFGRWNSTVSSIDGEIREGERIRIHVPGTKRTFTPRVHDMVQNKRMTWSDGLALVFKGSRSFMLQPCDDGTTLFIMKENFQGLVFALVKGMLPDFKGIFETYSNDLKVEAERLNVGRDQYDHLIEQQNFRQPEIA